jgi:hypothetical protein
MHTAYAGIGLVVGLIIAGLISVYAWQKWNEPTPAREQVDGVVKSYTVDGPHYNSSTKHNEYVHTITIKYSPVNSISEFDYTIVKRNRDSHESEFEVGKTVRTQYDVSNNSSGWICCKPLNKGFAVELWILAAVIAIASPFVGNAFAPRRY